MMRLSLEMHHSVHTLLLNVPHPCPSVNGAFSAARRPTPAEMHHMMKDIDIMHHVLYT